MSSEARVEWPALWRFADPKCDRTALSEALKGTLVPKEESHTVVKGIRITPPFSQEDASMLRRAPSREVFGVHKHKVEVAVLKGRDRGPERIVSTLETPGNMGAKSVSVRAIEPPLQKGVVVGFIGGPVATRFGARRSIPVTRDNKWKEEGIREWVEHNRLHLVGNELNERRADSVAGRGGYVHIGE